ncbi:uncharacterized protein METZ01_LOCUS199515, partial [marine metagenome]
MTFFVTFCQTNKLITLEEQTVRYVSR